LRRASRLSLNNNNPGRIVMGLVIVGQLDGTALHDANPQPIAINDGRCARCREIGTGSGVRNDELVEPCDRSRDIGGAVMTLLAMPTARIPESRSASPPAIGSAKNPSLLCVCVERCRQHSRLEKTTSAALSSAATSEKEPSHR